MRGERRRLENAAFCGTFLRIFYCGSLVKRRGACYNKRVKSKYILRLGDLEIAVERKKIKNLHLRVGRTGKISLTAPFFVSDGEIERFAAAKYGWLKKHLQTVKTEEFSYISEDKTQIFGQTVSLVYHAEKEGLCGGILFLRCGAEGAEERVKRILKRLLEEKIQQKHALWEQKTDLKVSSWYVRDMKTRWGTCNVSTGRICFNLRLAKKAEECLDYVIVHELGHLINRYHDKRFYKFLSYYFPDYKRVRKLLNE